MGDLYAKVEGGVWSLGKQKAPEPDVHGWQRTQAELLTGAFSRFIFFFLLTILGSFSPIAPVEIGITGQARALPSKSVSCVCLFSR